MLDLQSAEVLYEKHQLKNLIFHFTSVSTIACDHVEYPTTVFGNMHYSVDIVHSHFIQAQVWGKRDASSVKIISTALHNLSSRVISMQDDVYINNDIANSQAGK